MMIVLSGHGDAVAGTAVSSKCTGEGPCEVTGRLLFVADTEALLAGKKIYVNAVNTLPAPSHIVQTKNTHPADPVNMPSNDLKLYYYAVGETAGYGLLGAGYERTVRVTKGIGVQVDAGIAAVGNVSGDDPNIVNTDQLIQNLNGRVKFDATKSFGLYTAYRWNQTRADQQHWNDLSQKLIDKDFIAASSLDEQIVQSQGLEYGFTLRPVSRLEVSLGYIPQYRSDFGTFGVLTEPAYTAELRFSTGIGACRLRGISYSDFWQADFGITIR